MMGTFFAFSLKSALCLAVFYLFYKPLLSSEIFHRLNRATLLAIMALSLCIPLIAVFFVHVPAGGWTEPLLTEPAEAFLSEQPETPDGFAPSGGSRLHAVLLLIYLAGCGIFMLHTLWSLCRIVRLIRKSACRRLDGQIRLAVHADSRIMPFSWMNCIVVSRKDHDENADIIIRHEQSHIRRRHTADLLFAGICLLFQWYNPAAWLIYAELQNVHEYEADRDVLDGGADAKQYQLLLIRKTVGPKLYSMASSFNHSNLKKRITMMLQKNSNSWARLKYACVLPLAAICMAAFARPEIARPFDGISNVGIDHFVFTDNPVATESAAQPAPTASQPVPIVSPPAPVDTTVYTVVDLSPEYPGGTKALMDFISKNLRYPPEAIKTETGGRVILSFVIGNDGKLRDIRIVRGVTPELDAEAIRLIKAMPDWNPGKVKGEAVHCKYTLPITFRR